MRILAIAAVAALTLPVMPIATAAPAAAAEPQVRVVVGDQHRRHHHRRAYWRNECRTKWVHHHRERICHRVRAWR
ncbi:hypothetical protein [Sphingomonas sp.]|uniref:hypothetical protein n=1 Tax=Sphingomonas sp. TaxID=28214 RepID=UPI001B03A98A|nr:hypothetical protein [Sphingomonas sp.]MBO9713536.1 hypothetical protein [Sphingomonas sp.]